MKPFDKKVPLSCCGEKMTELVANSTDAAVEKHVPVVSVSGNAVHVEVGSVAHPMTDEHLIAFVCLVTEKGYQIAELTSADKPEADFAIAEGDRAIKVLRVLQPARSVGRRGLGPLSGASWARLALCAAAFFYRRCSCVVETGA